MTQQDDFSEAAKVPLDELHIEPFLETRKVAGFSCGNRDLDEFLCTEEVQKYEGEGLGSTFLVFWKGKLVAYFTTSFDALRIEYLRTWKSFSRMAEMRMDAIPALKIGRLAVATGYQGRGIGRQLIRHIAGMALESRGQGGVRLLVLQAKPESVEFYRKCGFELTFETRRERGKKNRTMFLDLHALEGVA